MADKNHKSGAAHGVLLHALGAWMADLSGDTARREMLLAVMTEALPFADKDNPRAAPVIAAAAGLVGDAAAARQGRAAQMPARIACAVWHEWRLAQALETLREGGVR